MDSWPLLLVLLGCCCLVVSRAQGILTSTLSGDMPFVQSFQDPKYKIEFHELDSPFTMTDDQEKIPMTDRDGKKYVCALSNPKVPHSGKTGDVQNGSGIGLVMDERSTRKSPEELLAEMKDFCYRRDEGWWSYVLCFKGDVRQFHADTSSGNKKGQITQEFMLGQYDKEATEELHRNSEQSFLQKDPRSQTAAQRYHVHLHTNGTKCDLTGEPRETEVRYFCSDNEQLMIRSIKEAPSCKYTVVVHVPALCKHSLFQGEQSPWVLIHCNEVA
ncbi:unnamed protein product [Calypogeia fissa]